MKILKNYAVLALLTVCSLYASAQGSTPPINEPDYNKPKIFSDLPETMTLQLAGVEAILNSPVGTQVNTTIAANFQLTGIVVSRSSGKEAAIKSVVIRSTNRNGATLTISRITKQDGSISYIGRMISKGSGDALEVVKEGNEYIIRKKNYYDLINE